MVNVNKLKGKIVENRMNVRELADVIGIDKATMYRKLNNSGESFTIGEMDSIIKALNLSLSEANAIFFSQYVAYNANSKEVT